jgi:hypothetical protein
VKAHERYYRINDSFSVLVDILTGKILAAPPVAGMIVGYDWVDVARGYVKQGYRIEVAKIEPVGGKSVLTPEPGKD